MRTARPAAWSAFAFHQPRAGSFDPLAPRFRLFGGLNPADPFIAGEEGNILPCRQCTSIGSKDLTQVRRHIMHYTCSDRFLGHGSIQVQMAEYLYASVEGGE